MFSQKNNNFNLVQFRPNYIIKTNSYGQEIIHFFNDREVRMVWDDENNCRWFAATDVMRAINKEPDYTKASNYWRQFKSQING